MEKEKLITGRRGNTTKRELNFNSIPEGQDKRYMLKARSIIEALFWLGMFILIFEKSKIAEGIVTDTRLISGYLELFFLLSGMNCFIILYLTFIARGDSSDEKQYSENLILVLTCSSLLAGLCLIISIYPVYKLAGLVIVPGLALGFMMTVQLIPIKGEGQSVGVVVLFLTLLVYSYFYH